MGNLFGTGPNTLKRLSRVLVILILPALAGLLAITLAAQEPSKPPKEEEDPNHPKPKKVLHLEDDTQQAGLAYEADQATNPELQSLYRGLAVPYDVVTLKNGKIWKVVPLKRWAVGHYPASFDIQPYDNDKWEHNITLSIQGSDVASIDFYEQMAFRQVDAFLKKTLDREPAGSKTALSRLEMLQGAEKVLSAAIRVHESSREGGPGVREDLVKPLRDKLLEVQLAQLNLQTDWVPAFELASRLAEAYPAQEDIQIKLAQPLARFVQVAIDQQNYPEAHVRLKVLEEQFGHSPAVVKAAIQPINEALREKAQAKFNQAREVKAKDPAKAKALLDDAEEIFPSLPGLHYEKLTLGAHFHPLLVGVRHVPKPENLWPLTAYADADRQGVELLFESLVKSVDDPAGGQRYLPELAQDRPRLIPLGRQFDLVEATWPMGPEGQRLSAADVRQTWQLLEARGQADMIADVRDGANPFQVNITLNQGYLDPLSLMTFKILPPAANPDHADAKKFREKPFGSGPFQFKEIGDKNHAIFIANPFYHRAGKTGLPKIAEIHFFESKDPASDFTKGNLHLLLDLPTKSIRELRSLEPKVTVKTLRNKRIYFLAINHAWPQLGGEENKKLRQAIAFAIDRNKVLDTVFRDKDLPLPQPPHRPLYGPYPPGSWADSPEPKTFNSALAKTLAQEGAHGSLKLTLKYPDDDKQAEEACRAISAAVAGLGTGLEIQSVPRNPRDLHADVEENFDYELAYYSYDFPNDTYNLWPLFDDDPQARLKKNGHNYLGYHDGTLVTLLHQARERRDFKAPQKGVQALTFQIGARIADQLPFIPLWQLDTHVAVSADLVTKDMYAPTIFSDAEEWELKTP